MSPCTDYDDEPPEFEPPGGYYDRPECEECGGTQEIEVEYPASRFAEEPDIRTHPCPRCTDYDDEPPEFEPPGGYYDRPEPTEF